MFIVNIQLCFVLYQAIEPFEINTAAQSSFLAASSLVLSEHEVFLRRTYPSFGGEKKYSWLLFSLNLPLS